MKNRYVSVIFSLTLFTVCSCFSSNVTNLSPALLHGDPVVSTYTNPEASFSSYRTFSVFSHSETSKKKSSNPILEHKIIFYVRNLMEAKNYQYVEMDQNPDFLVAVYVDAEYRQVYIPPSQVRLPYYSYGKTEATYERPLAPSGYTSFDKYLPNQRDTWRGTEATTTNIQGTWTKKTYSRRGYAARRHCPAAVVSIYDSGSLESVWIGNGAGVSDNPELSVSTQGVLSHIVRDLPKCRHTSNALASCGTIGMHYSIMTTDGKLYYPFVVGLDRGKPAARKGIKPDDKIIEIDGVSTMNKSFSEIAQDICGKPGEEIAVKAKRNNKIITFHLVRAPR